MAGGRAIGTDIGAFAAASERSSSRRWLASDCAWRCVRAKSGREETEPKPHDTPLITTIVAGLVLAFLLGAVANRLRMSPLVGCLLAGVLIGPARPALSPRPRSRQRSPRSARCC